MNGTRERAIAHPGLCGQTSFLSELRHKDRPLVQLAAIQLESFLDRTRGREFHVGVHVSLARPCPGFDEANVRDCTATLCVCVCIQV